MRGHLPLCWDICPKVHLPSGVEIQIRMGWAQTQPLSPLYSVSNPLNLYHLPLCLDIRQKVHLPLGVEIASPQPWSAEG